MITRSGGFRSYEDLREHLRSLADDSVRASLTRALLDDDAALDIDLLDRLVTLTREKNDLAIDQAIEKLRAAGFRDSPPS